MVNTALMEMLLEEKSYLIRVFLARTTALTNEATSTELWFAYTLSCRLNISMHQIYA